ncbi:MAG: YcxB family protein [Filifactor alocis]|nr:YcxB family protein [Filifactor alocis]
MEEGGRLRFSFDFTKQDYVDFSMFAIEGMKFYRRQKKLFHIVFTLIPPGMWLFFWLMEGRGRIDFVDKCTLSVMGVLSFLFYRYFPKFYDALILANTKKIIFKEGRSNIFGRTTVEFGEDKLLHITEYEESSMRYEKITKVMESDKAIYLFTAPSMAVILPLRVFESREEKEAFAEFIGRKVGC